MAAHQRYLNLGDKGWLRARYGCDGWYQQRKLTIYERVSEAVHQLEEPLQKHAGMEASPTHALTPPSE